MKKSRKLVSVLLALVLAVSVFALPAAAAPSGGKYDNTMYPTVFVHGLMGWGSYDDINDLVPYWGMSTGDLPDYLNSKGYNCYAASVGPLSSAWDRACELYAQLTGSRVDYGAAHSAKYGHARYGVDYGPYNQLIPGYKWSAENKINLVGHSFGGATSRLLLSLLYKGSAQERAATTDGSLSPLFTGGRQDWVYSLTAIVAPSDGTTFIEANGGMTRAAAMLTTALSKALGVSKLKDVYDFQLEHFGIYKNDNETMTQALDRVLRSSFLDHNDNAFEDLTIDRAVYLNSSIEMPGNVYYFSYYGNRMYRDELTDTCRPAARMWAPMQIFAYNSGKYTGVTAGSFADGYGSAKTTVTVAKQTLGRDWQPGDGMVNVISGRCPYHLENGKAVWDAHVNYGLDTVKSGDDIQPGRWYIMRMQLLDHIGFVGGFFNESTLQTHQFYLDVMNNIAQCK